MKIPDCDRCLLYAKNPHLICAVHPTGPDSDTCLDFREDLCAESEEQQWEPEGASYYNGELIIQLQGRSPEEQLWHECFRSRNV